MTVKDKRPVNLDIGTIQLPLAAYASILHRISGILLFIGIAVLLYLLQKSLSGSAGFTEVQTLFSSAAMKLLVWAVLSALAYHLVAGCKHLLMDMGIGETRKQAPVSAAIVLVVSAVLIAGLGVLVW